MSIPVLCSITVAEAVAYPLFGNFTSSGSVFFAQCVKWSLFSQPLWRAAVAQFERLMAPSEQEVAGRLKSYIAHVQDNPQQVTFTLIANHLFSHFDVTNGNMCICCCQLQTCKYCILSLYVCTVYMYINL